MIAVIGAQGQLATELLKEAEHQQLDLLALGRQDCPIEIGTRVAGALEKLQPEDVVINTAAFHVLEECELRPEVAWAVNAEGSRHAATICTSLKLKYVYISTAYCQASPTDENGLPRSVYAKTKLAGELAALSICPDALVVRIDTLYGVTGCRAKGGGNFIDTVVEKVKKQEPFGLPDYTAVLTTYAKHAAQRILGNLQTTGVTYADDGGKPASHYKIGCRLAAYLGLPNKIQAVSVDPNDTLRPYAIDAPTDRWGYRWPHLKRPHPRIGGQFLSDYEEDPLEAYLIEKGYMDAKSSDAYTADGEC